jgi:thioredoxin 1
MSLKLSSFFLKSSLNQHQSIRRGLHSSSLLRATFNVQDEADFKKRVIENEKTVIVDFHAVWCGPCKILGPKLEKVMGNFEDKADFAKVDIDQLGDLAMDYKVNAVPTVVAIKKGKEVGKFVGMLDDDRLKKFVKDAIDK